MKVKMKVKMTVGNASEKIQAIKTYRALTGAGLKESKDIIEATLRQYFGVESGDYLTGRAYSIIVDSPNEYDIRDIIDRCNNDPLTLRAKIVCSLESASISINKKMDFTGSINGNESKLVFTGQKIEAKMTVNSDKMLDIVKWVVDNF